MKPMRMLAVAGALLMLTGTIGACAADVHVMISGGLTAAFKELSADFEKRTGNHVIVAYGPSMGTTENAIPVRLARGEPVDVLIMVGDALGKLVEEGKAVGATRVDLVRSPIGVSVKAGAPAPDVTTIAGLKAALLAAKSIAYSDSASGVYVEKQLFAKLGIEAEVKGKARMIPAEPVAAVVARGDAEIGFQQVSELLPVAGAQFVGKIPDEVQKITVFSAAVATKAESAEAGKALIAFLAAPEARPVMTKTGLEPIH